MLIKEHKFQEGLLCWSTLSSFGEDTKVAIVRWNLWLQQNVNKNSQ